MIERDTSPCATATVTKCGAGSRVKKKTAAAPATAVAIRAMTRRRMSNLVPGACSGAFLGISAPGTIGRPLPRAGLHAKAQPARKMNALKEIARLGRTVYKGLPRREVSAPAWEACRASRGRPELSPGLAPIRSLPRTSSRAHAPSVARARARLDRLALRAVRRLPALAQPEADPGGPRHRRG